jgi:WD40 repeat protein
MKHTGLTRIALGTGTRTWTPYENRSAVIDALARMMPQGTVARFYHHAVMLEDGRIVQSNAYRYAGESVTIRHPGEKGDPVPDMIMGDMGAGIDANPDGSTYATGEFRVLRIRDAKTDQVLHELRDDVSDGLWGDGYSPDGSRFAIGTEDGRVIVYDTEFFEKLCDIRLPPLIEGKRNYVFNLMWTPDGTRLVTCGAGTVIRILESQRPLQRDHRKAVWNEALERARQSLVSNGTSSFSDDALDRAAMLVVRIEQWAAAQKTNEKPAGE